MDHSGSEISLINSEIGKDILKCGLMQMTDDAIQQATLAKQASHETSHLHVILTAWEIEEAERHAELLCLLQCTNMQVYEEASDEASWFERFLSDRSLAQVQQDFNLNLKVYNNDLSLFVTTDGLLNEIENHAEEYSKETARRVTVKLTTVFTIQTHQSVVKPFSRGMYCCRVRSPLPMASKKGKGKAKRVSPSPDDLQYTSGYCTNLDNPSQSSLDMDFNHASSSDASFGVQVLSMQQPYHDNHFPPSSNLSFTAAAPNSSFPPFSPYFDVSNPYLTSLNPNHDVIPPTLNLAPLNPVAASAPNIVAPHPWLPHDTTALELMVQSYRELLFLRHQTLEAHTSVRSQPYNLTVHRGTSSNDILQARQFEFEAEASAVHFFLAGAATTLNIYCSG
ncbi:hypothetical protein BD769DRAFT_1385664 [Suillus cothurnatus]|nr:hypothetical protein BD769DRAFT_1385664 [Suillus cothurnatus]